MIEPKKILIDFDGTCLTHAFPLLGKEIGAVPVLKDLVKYGHKLILFTMRSNNEKLQPERLPDDMKDEKTVVYQGGNYLTQAVNWFKSHDIPLYGVNANPTQHAWTTSPKAYGDLMIDDSALGVPLRKDKSLSDRPFVDWSQVRIMLSLKGYLPIDSDAMLYAIIYELHTTLAWQNSEIKFNGLPLKAITPTSIIEMTADQKAILLQDIIIKHFIY